MSELEEKLASLLANPQLMGQIQAMAQNFTSGPAPAPSAPPQPTLPQGISGLLSAAVVDDKQQNLLCALSPYLSQRRVEKLERAMRAAKMASTASSLLHAGALDGLLGR